MFNFDEKNKLHQQVYQGDLLQLKVELSKTPSAINSLDDKYKISLLAAACEGAHPDVVEFLLENKADVTLGGLRLRRSCLSHAARHPDIASLIVEKSEEHIKNTLPTIATATDIEKAKVVLIAYDLYGYYKNKNKAKMTEYALIVKNTPSKLTLEGQSNDAIAAPLHWCQMKIFMDEGKFESAKKSLEFLLDGYSTQIIKIFSIECGYDSLSMIFNHPPLASITILKKIIKLLILEINPSNSINRLLPLLEMQGASIATFPEDIANYLLSQIDKLENLTSKAVAYQRLHVCTKRISRAVNPREFVKVQDAIFAALKKIYFSFLSGEITDPNLITPEKLNLIKIDTAAINMLINVEENKAEYKRELEKLIPHPLKYFIKFNEIFTSYKDRQLFFKRGMFKEELQFLNINYISMLKNIALQINNNYCKENYQALNQMVNGLLDFVLELVKLNPKELGAQQIAIMVIDLVFNLPNSTPLKQELLPNVLNFALALSQHGPVLEEILKGILCLLVEQRIVANSLKDLFSVENRPQIEKLLQLAILTKNKDILELSIRIRFAICAFLLSQLKSKREYKELYLQLKYIKEYLSRDTINSSMLSALFVNVANNLRLTAEENDITVDFLDEKHDQLCEDAVLYVNFREIKKLNSALGYSGDQQETLLNPFWKTCANLSETLEKKGKLAKAIYYLILLSYKESESIPPEIMKKIKNIFEKYLTSESPSNKNINALIKNLISRLSTIKNKSSVPEIFSIVANNASNMKFDQNKVDVLSKMFVYLLKSPEKNNEMKYKIGYQLIELFSQQNSYEFDTELIEEALELFPQHIILESIPHSKEDMSKVFCVTYKKLALVAQKQENIAIALNYLLKAKNIEGNNNIDPDQICSFSELALYQQDLIVT